MPGRSLNPTDYRYGYQGQFSEKDNETNQNSFVLRNYDGLLGRWMTIDPYGQYHSPYNAMGNNPVNMVDPDGGKGTDWYEPFGGGDAVWFDGSDEHAGYTHLSGFDYNGGFFGGNLSEVVTFSGPGGQGGGRNYGGDGSGSFMDNTYYVADQINQWNPIANGWDALTGYIYGTDRLGNSQSSFETNLKLASTIPIGRVGSIVTNSFKGLSKSYLKSIGIQDIHAFKAEWLGTNVNLKLFDVVRHTETKELLIIRKQTQEVIINTKIIAE